MILCTAASRVHYSVRYYKHKKKWEGRTSWPILWNRIYRASSNINIQFKPWYLAVKMDSTICHVCGVESSKFRKKCLFNDHVKSHQSDRNFICPYCGKCYQQYYSLLNHQNKYHSTISNTCETCGSNFSAKSHLERHKKVVHERSNNFVCEVCTKSFSLNEHLKLKNLHVKCATKYMETH